MSGCIDTLSTHFFTYLQQLHALPLVNICFGPQTLCMLCQKHDKLDSSYMHASVDIELWPMQLEDDEALLSNMQDMLGAE